MKPTSFLLPLLLAAPVYCVADTDLMDLLPPDTQVVFGMKVRSVVDSELARSLSTEIKGQAAAQWQAMVATTGFDPLHDLDEVVIGSTGSGKNAPTLVVAHGTFDIAKLAANAEDYHGVPLVSNKGGQQQVFGFLDGTTAVAGQAEVVKAAIDRRAEPAHLDAALAAKVNEYRNRYDVWAVVNRIDGISGMIPDPKSPAAALNSIDRLQFGVSVKQGLELAAEAHARTAKDAEQLAATLQFLEAMTKAQPASAGTQFSFKNEDGTLKVALTVSEEDLKKGIEQRQKAGFAFGSLPPVPPPSHTVTSPVEPAPKPAAPGNVAAAPAQPSKPVAPGVGPDGNATAVFTLPGQR